MVRKHPPLYNHRELRSAFKSNTSVVIGGFCCLKAQVLRRPADARVSPSWIFRRLDFTSCDRPAIHFIYIILPFAV